MGNTGVDSKSEKIFRNNLKNLRGTFAVEGMAVSRESVKNLNRLVTGKADCAELVDEVKRKYIQKV